MSLEAPQGGAFKPRILVFSTHNISDPGIDLAGSRHMHYPAPVSTIAVPCSSGLKPSWIVHALQAGIDGVFIASDGDECAYLPDCSERTARIASQAQDLLRAQGQEHVIVLVGGIVPDEDISRLQEAGIGGVFGPGASTEAIATFIRQAVAEAATA